MTMPSLDISTSPAPEAEGYRIHFDVVPTGYRVSDPVPLPAPSDGEGDVVSDLVQAVKELLLVVSEHPAGGDEAQSFRAALGDGNELLGRGSDIGMDSQGGV